MTITDQELLALLGKKDVELYLAHKANEETAAALKAAKAELEQLRPSPAADDAGG